jgi:hypothetical protein
MMRRRADVASYVVDGTPIVPLYRSPTLTDEEREALTYAAGSLLEQFIELGDKQDREMSDRVKAVIHRLK